MPISDAEKNKRYRARRLAEIAEMPKLPCACGCGTLIAPINKQLKPATYAHGHNPTKGGCKPGTSPWKGKQNPHLIAANKNRIRTPEEIAKRTASRYAKYGPSYGAARGFKRSESDIAKNRERGKTLVGAKNPFYGKTHTPETRAILAAQPPTMKGKHHTQESRKRISDSITGALHWNWKGGKACLPYGPGFTRKFKKLIRQRDNYTCQRCGKTQEQEGRVLQVHHLDHDKTHNDPSNLVTSCGSCNVWASYHRDEPFRS
jgi:hypothetical protein